MFTFYSKCSLLPHSTLEILSMKFGTLCFVIHYFCTISQWHPQNLTDFMQCSGLFSSTHLQLCFHNSAIVAEVFCGLVCQLYDMFYIGFKSGLCVVNLFFSTSAQWHKQDLINSLQSFGVIFFHTSSTVFLNSVILAEVFFWPCSPMICQMFYIGFKSGLCVLK